MLGLQKWKVDDVVEAIAEMTDYSYQYTIKITGMAWVNCQRIDVWGGPNDMFQTVFCDGCGCYFTRYRYSVILHIVCRHGKRDGEEASEGSCYGSPKWCVLWFSKLKIFIWIHCFRLCYSLHWLPTRLNELSVAFILYPSSFTVYLYKILLLRLSFFLRRYGKRYIKAKVYP